MATTKGGIEIVAEMARFGVQGQECQYCTAEITRGTLHNTCTACRAKWTQEFGSEWHLMPFHREMLDMYKETWNGSGRSPLDKTGNTQIVHLTSDEPVEIFSEERIEALPKGFIPDDVSYWTAYKAIRQEVFFALAIGEKVPGRMKMHRILIEEYGFQERPAPITRIVRRRKMVEVSYKARRGGKTVIKKEMQDTGYEETVAVKMTPKGNYCPAAVTLEKYIAAAKAELMAQADFSEWAGMYRMDGDTLAHLEYDEAGQETLRVIARKPVRLAEERKKRGKKAA